ncbi:hypothetical protein AA16663_1760 [Komagataeibacter rhaeticus DSM 16663]|nr:hypothetical protein AA16663_1760 [Komagataeibacter rhaeticus DSM 16663]
MALPQGGHGPRRRQIPDWCHTGYRFLKWQKGNRRPMLARRGHARPVMHPPHGSGGTVRGRDITAGSGRPAPGRTGGRFTPATHRIRAGTQPRRSEIVSVSFLP